MTEIITGGAQSSREKVFTDRIKRCALEGARVLVIVPDQFSFDYDKMLYDAMGPQLFNKITTTGFNRLAELMGQEYGSSADLADENARLILMFKAVHRADKEGTVRYYKRSLDKPELISELTQVCAKLRESGITSEDLQTAAERTYGSLSMKLFDLALISKLYLEELESCGLRDSISVMSEAVRLAQENDHFGLTQVFVSSYNDFTYDEYRMLELCMRQADSLTVSLLLDDKSHAAASVFGVTVRTRQQLINMARAQGSEIKLTKLSDNEGGSFDIALLGERLFDYSKKEYKTTSDSVQVLCGDDVYEEADYICAEICRLVREEGYRLEDIAVTVRDIDSFAPVIRSAMERYDIAYYIDCRDSVDASAIVHYINAIFRAVLTRRFRTENIMKLIRSPLYGILEYEVSDLEDYCVMWGIDGDLWLEDFRADSQEGVSLSRINEIRRRVITPLAEFKKAAADSTAGEISKAFYKLLEDIRLSEQTYSLVKRAGTVRNETTQELARGLKQLWNMSLGAVRSICELMGQDKVSLRRYYDLYSVMLGRMKVSQPPQKLECVRVTDALHSRLTGIRAVFAAQVNDGVFPQTVKNHGLMTEQEKQLLSRQEGLEIRDNVHNDLSEERLAAYTTLCSPKDRLYVTYSGSDLLGQRKRPSSLVREVTEILGVQVRRINSLPLEFFCTSYKTAFVKYLEYSKLRPQETAVIREALMGSQLYYSKLSSVGDKRAQQVKLSKRAAQQLFFKTDDIEVSPTKLDKYFKCPFDYFCSYGLNLKRTQRVEINSLNRGLIVHKVMEEAVPTNEGSPKANRERLLAMTDEEIKSIIDRCFEEYYNGYFCTAYAQPETFRYRFDQLREKTFYMVKYVRKELEQGGFAPAVTEYKINRENGSDQLDLTLSDGRRIVLIGTIDRADIYENEQGRKFVRIVDYKVRKRISFDLGDLYCGLDLQMLIYLSLLLENGEILGDEDLHQAGVFYFKLTESGSSLSEDSELSDEELYEAAKQSAVDAYSRIGRISDAEGVNKVLGGITPQGLGRIVMSDQMFTAMRIFAKKKVIEYGNRLLQGDISPVPMEGVCRYCEFSGICPEPYPDVTVKGSSQLLEEELKKLVSEEGDK